VSRATILRTQVSAFEALYNSPSAAVTTEERRLASSLLHKAFVASFESQVFDVPTRIPATSNESTFIDEEEVTAARVKSLCATENTNNTTSDEVEGLLLYRCAAGALCTTSIGNAQLHSMCSNKDCPSHDYVGKYAHLRSKLHDICRFNVWKGGREKWPEETLFCSITCSFAGDHQQKNSPRNYS
jgi:hypothetical protein